VNVFIIRKYVSESNIRQYITLILVPLTWVPKRHFSHSVWRNT